MISKNRINISDNSANVNKCDLNTRAQSQLFIQTGDHKVRIELSDNSANVKK